MLHSSRQATTLVVAVLILGALGVLAAFVKTVGGFGAAVDFAHSVMTRLDQLIR